MKSILIKINIKVRKKVMFKGGRKYPTYLYKYIIYTL